MPVPTLTLTDGRTVFLGRARPKARPLTLKLGDYLGATRGPIPIPESVDYHTKAAASISRVYGNDREGCCVISDRYHSIGVWTANATGTALLATDAEVHATYKLFSPVGDTGCVITDVLDYAKATGIPVGGVRHKLDGFVAFDWRNRDQVKTAVFLAGACPIGINLPSAWQTADVWDATNSPIIGGHDVACVGFSSRGVQIASWGRIYTITWDAFQSARWLEEAYMPLSLDWYKSGDVAACGVDVAELRRDLDKIGGGGIPPIVLHDDPPPPPPDPVKPPVVPPDPVGLTLVQAINAAAAGIDGGRPYPMFGSADKAKQWAARGLTAAWPKPPK